MTVQMPSSPGVGQSAVIRAELTGTRVSALDNNGARIFFKHNGAALVGGLQDVVSLPGGQVGAQFNVQNLNAGTYNITVEYEGNSFYEPVTCTPSGTEATAPNCPRTLTLVIDKFTPTVTLDAITAVQVGSNLTISGNVSGSGLRSPAGGSVSFFLGGTSGTLLGTDDTIAADGDVSVPVATGLGTNFPDAYNGAIQIGDPECGRPIQW
ncbi:hypothetical protein [Candidatus Amarobacter glycogenicus]|uniref:hypothetical protein n=1 Tax=Candidatus Amarobacter glycogenicus TaxID=3140699 RepID=UPI002A112CC3|nr:hypothetical protein [Dehalococcoidia bacterium]